MPSEDLNPPSDSECPVEDFGDDPEPLEDSEKAVLKANYKVLANKLNAIRASGGILDQIPTETGDAAYRKIDQILDVSF